MYCPRKPGLRCAGTPGLAAEGRCLGCTAGGRERAVSGRFAGLKVKSTSKDLVNSKSKPLSGASGSAPSKHFGVNTGVKGVYFTGEAP